MVSSSEKYSVKMEVAQFGKRSQRTQSLHKEHKGVSLYFLVFFVFRCVLCDQINPKKTHYRKIK